MDAGLRQISSSASREEDRYRYWRQVAGWGSEIGMPAFHFEISTPAGDFHSYLHWRPADRATHFLESLVSVPVSQTARPDVQGDVIVVGGLRKGCLRIEHNRGMETTIMPRELIVSDYGRQMRMFWSPHNFLFLVLPRRMVEKAIGGAAGFAGQTVHKLPNRGLAPLLWAHLETIARHGHELDTVEWSVATCAAADMALTILHRTFAAPRTPSALPNLALLEAAKRYMERHSGDCELTAGQICSALGCSRAQLYRVLSQFGLAVGGYLRDVRLDRARAMLEIPSPHTSIGAIAYGVGYTDLSAFGKAFRRRFGMTPKDWRALQPGNTRVEHTDQNIETSGLTLSANVPL